jgi:hypothetical protein
MSILDFFSKPAQGSERTIRVEFINAADNSIMGVSKMAPAQLPDTFAINTTLDIKNQKWSVASAEPMEKGEFLKTGKLRLVLSPLTSANPADILFSLPTISDDIGNAQGNTPPSETVFAIHEDDWRQIEFVWAQYSPEIEKEFADIRQIWASEKSGPGFKKLHVRKRIPEPLGESSLHVEDLSKVVPPQKRFDSVGFQRTLGTIPQSFAWSAGPHVVVWGIANPDGKIRRLCLSGLAERDQVAPISAALAEMTERYQIYLVDWCRTAKIRSDAKAFENYLSRQG